MSWRVPLFDLRLGQKEADAVLGVLRSGWLSRGPLCREVDQKLTQLFGAPSVYVSSCTAALHLAMRLLRLGPGDEVVVPTMSFVSTVSPVLMVGATPRFADIPSPENPNLARETVEGLLGPNTKAVIFMHYAGYSRGLDGILDLCRERGIFLVEDAAHGVGAWRLRGDLGAVSFFANKNITSGEGGALVARSQEQVELAFRLASNGITVPAEERYRGLGLYDVAWLGYNYRPTELQAGLLLAQLDKLGELNRRRAELVVKYREALAGTEITPIFPDEDPRKAANYIFAVLLPPGVDRNRVARRMAEKGIQTSLHYRPIHTFTYYRERFGQLRLPKAEEMARRAITLPLFPHMEDWQLELVVESLLGAVSELS